MRHERRDTSRTIGRLFSAFSDFSHFRVSAEGLPVRARTDWFVSPSGVHYCDHPSVSECGWDEAFPSHLVRIIRTPPNRDGGACLGIEASAPDLPYIHRMSYCLHVSMGRVSNYPRISAQNDHVLHGTDRITVTASTLTEPDLPRSPSICPDPRDVGHDTDSRNILNLKIPMSLPRTTTTTTTITTGRRDSTIHTSTI